MRILFSLKPRNHFGLKTAFNWFAADRQILLICKLKLSWSSIWIPSNSTDDTTFKCWLLTTIRWFVWSLFLFSNKMASNLSGLTIILLFLSQTITISGPDCKTSINSKIIWAKADNVLSSAILWREASDTKKNESFIVRLKNIGPNIDLWGTPDFIFW